MNDEKKPAGKFGRSGFQKKNEGRNKKPGGGFSRDRRGFNSKSGDSTRFRQQNRRPAAEQKAEPVGLASRRVALNVIRDVTERGGWASICLNERLTRSGLSSRDRRLVTRLAYDTIGNLRKIDWALKQVMAKPDTDIRLVNILRLGACQMLLEDGIPESAACNTSVMLCKELELGELSGVCNGILRSLSRQKEHLSWPDEQTEPLTARAVRWSVPEWLVEELDADWGRETADALLAAPWQETVTIRPNLTRLDDEQFARLLDGKVWQREPGLVPHAVRIRGMADLGSDADFQAGAFSIEGEGSMAACYALAPKRGMQVLDACAAPGGKACLLAELMGGTGRVQAWELHPHRTALIAAQAQRLGLENVRPITRDASVLREDLFMTMDAVLLDAPCTGLGTLADKPDLKLRVSRDSLKELTTLQAVLLDVCCRYVKPGGTLVYSTCSILKDENERQIEAFLASHPEYELLPMPETIPAPLRQYEATGLQLMPHRDGTDGFYIARMRRKRT